MPPSSPGFRGELQGLGSNALRITRGMALLVAVFLTGVAQSSTAPARKVRITGLTDVDFGLVNNLLVENRRSQSICVFSSSVGSAYSISASGSGLGGSFALENGPTSLPFDVEWSQQAGQSTGTQLLANGTLTGQTSAATHQFCNGGPAASATLTVILRAAALSQAREGTYSGSLTILISAE